MKSMSAQDFNRDVSAAKRSANAGPVVITDRGNPAYVLMSIADYRALEQPRSSLAALLAADHDYELELPERTVSVRDLTP